MSSKVKLTTTTKRLKIRSLIKADYQKWKSAFSSLGPKKNRWDWGNIPDHELNKESFYKQLEKIKNGIKEDSNYRLGVFDKKSGELIGYVFFMDVSRGIFQNAYIGYQLLNPYWGFGFGEEMVRGAIRLAFNHLKLHRLEAGISPSNRKSIRLAKKIGFRKEGRSKRRLYLNGEWKDFMIYALTSEDLTERNT